MHAVAKCVAYLRAQIIASRQLQLRLRTPAPSADPAPVSAPCSLLLASLLINKALYSCPERLRQTGRQKGAYTWKNNTKIISWPYKKSHICIFCKYSPYHLKNI